MNNAVSNNPALSRYELAVDGHYAATYYEIAGGLITFVHTEVPPELGGKGIGSKLVQGTLDHVRSPVCICGFTDLNGWSNPFVKWKS
jgi:predicted GNAT family acetyltransferase